MLADILGDHRQCTMTIIVQKRGKGLARLGAEAGFHGQIGRVLLKSSFPLAWLPVKTVFREPALDLDQDFLADAGCAFEGLAAECRHLLGGASWITLKGCMKFVVPVIIARGPGPSP